MVPEAGLFRAVSRVSFESHVDRYVLEKSKENNVELTRLKWLNRATLVPRARLHVNPAHVTSR